MLLNNRKVSCCDPLNSEPASEYNDDLALCFKDKLEDCLGSNLDDRLEDLLEEFLEEFLDDAGEALNKLFLMVENLFNGDSDDILELEAEEEVESIDIELP